MLTSFINNFALLFTVTFSYSYIITRLPKESTARKILSGLVFGTIAVMGMSVPYIFSPGIIFDQRTVILSVCAAFAGPLPTIIASVITGFYRIILGGAGTLTGLLSIVSASSIGLIFYLLVKKQRIPVNLFTLSLLGIVVHEVLLALMLTLPGDAGRVIILTMGPAIMLIFTFSTIVAGFVLNDMDKRQMQAEQVHLSEKKYRFLFESMTQGVTYLREGGEITSANRAALKILGMKENQLKEKTPYDATWQAVKDNGEDFPANEHPSIKALTTGEEVKNIIMGIYNAAEKRRRWIKIDAIPQFKEGESKPYEVFTIFEDITQQKNNELLIKGALARVEKNEQLLKEAERIAALGAWEYDVATGHLEGSDGLYTLYGLNRAITPTLEDIIGYCHEGHRMLVKTALLSCMDNNKPIEIEFEISTAANENKWILVIGRGVIDEKGKVSRLKGIAQDITAAKHAALKIEESEKKYRLLAENIKDVIVLLDEELRYTYVSPSVQQVRGYEPGELLGAAYIDYIHHEDKERVAEWFRRIINGETDEVSQVYRVTQREHGYIWVEVKTHRITDKSGTSVLISKRDITTRIEAMQKLKESERNYKTLFEHQPNIIWEEDFSGVKERIEHLKNMGVTNLGEYLGENEEELRHLASLVLVIRMNEASVRVLEAETKEEVSKHLPDYFDSEEAWSIFRNELHTLSMGKDSFTAEIPVKTLKGKRKTLDLKLIIPEEFKDNWQRVLVSFTDVTEVKENIDRLHRSEEKFKNYFQNSTEAIHVAEFESDIEVTLPAEKQADLMLSSGIIADCNDAFAKLFEFEKREDAIGIKSSPVPGTLLYKQSHELLKKFIESGYALKGYISETMDITGRLFYASNTLTGQIVNGKLVRMWASQYDVTEKVLQDLRLGESEIKYRNIVESSHDLIWTLNRDGVIMFINKAVEVIFGFKVEELIGKKFTDLITVKDLENHRNAVRRMMEQNESYIQIEAEYIRKDNISVHLLSNVTVLKAEDGSIIGVTGSSKDITDSVQIREQMLVNQVRLETAKEIAKLGYWEIPLDGDKVYFSDEVFTILGSTGRTELQTFEDYLRLVHPDDRETVEKATMKAKAGKAELNLVHRVLAGKEGMKYVHERGRLQFTPDFKPVKLSGTMQDVTELKQIEEELRTKAAEIEESRKQIRSLISYQNELREEERKSIAREIHDEIGQILTSVKLHLGLLSKKITRDKVVLAPEKLESEISGLMNKMDESVKMVRSIIRTLRPEFLDSLGLIPALEFHIEEYNAKTGIECTFINNYGNGTFSDVAASVIFRIVQESLINITRHSKAQKAMVELSEKEAHIYLRIIDNGIGMDVNKKQTGHFGLLGIRERVEGINGKITIKSSQGQGTVIEVIIPKRKNQPDEIKRRK